MGRLLLVVLSLIAVLATPLEAQSEAPMLRLDPQGPSSIVNAVVFTADGRQVITAGDDKVIRVYEVASGKLTRSIRAWIGEGVQGKIYALALDPSGRWLACGGWFKGTSATGAESSSSIRIYDFTTGELESLVSGHHDSILFLAFSPDRQWLASGDGSGVVRLWSVENWTAGPSLTEGHSNAVYGLAFSPDGQQFATVSDDRKLMIHRVVDGATVARREAAHDADIMGVAWSPDGTRLVTGGADGCAKLWSSTLTPLGTVKQVDSGALNAVAFLDDHRIVCGGSHRSLHDGQSLNPLYLVDLDGGREQVLWCHTNVVQALAVSPDGIRLVSTGGDNSETLVWNLFTFGVEQTLRGNGRGVWAVGWIDGGPAFGGINEGYARLGTNNLDTWFSWSARQVVPQAPREAGLRVLLTWGDETLSHSGQPNDRVLKVGDRSLTLPDANDTVRCFSFTPDGASILVGSAFGLHRYDRATLALTDTYVGHEGSIWGLSASPDRRVFVTGGTDQTLRFWDLDHLTPVRLAAFFDHDLIGLLAERFPFLDLSRPEHIALLQEILSAETGLSTNDFIDNSNPTIHRPLLSLFIADNPDRDWLAWTPEGYYDCSLNGAQYAGWHFNRGEDQNAEFYSLEQYASVFYRPDVIEKALSRVPFDPPTQIDFSNRPPLITNFEVNGQPVYDQGEITVTTDKKEFTVSLASTATSVLKVPELFYNGRAISQPPSKGAPQVKLAPDKLSLQADYTFTVTAPDNRYKIFTVDARGFRSEAKVLHVVYTGKDVERSYFTKTEKVPVPQPKGTLWVVAAGINRYTDPGMAKAGLGGLEWAEKDARDMANLWKAQEGKLFARVETKVLVGAVTKAALLEALTELGKGRVKEGDSVLVFLSGHGMRKDAGFYYLTSEADPTSESRLDVTAAGWKEIGTRLKALVKAKEVVVMADACHSGAMNPTELGFTWKDQGLLLITSSRAGQLSYEGKGNGYFTQAVEEGFQKVGPAAHADASGDGVLIVGEVMDWAVKRVGELSQGQQTPWIPGYDPALEGKILGVVR